MFSLVERLFSSGSRKTALQNKKIVLFGIFKGLSVKLTDDDRNEECKKCGLHARVGRNLYGICVKEPEFNGDNKIFKGVRFHDCKPSLESAKKTAAIMEKVDIYCRCKRNAPQIDQWASLDLGEDQHITQWGCLCS